MRKHFIIALILLFSLSLSACNKAEIPTETSSILPTQETEIIEETSSQIPTSEPVTTEKLTTQVVIPKEEQRENVSTTITTLQQIPEVKPTQKPKPIEDKTTLKNVTEPTKPVEKTTVQTTEKTTQEQKVDIDYYVNYAKNYALNIGLTYDAEATECWDNPISITSKTTSTIANIESRLNRYKDLEGFESVCIWYEKRGKNDYDLYIGYA